MSFQHTLRLHLLALLAAGGMCFANAAHSVAADCGCESSCSVCEPVSADCNCAGPKKKHNCVYKALDAFAGGIEKLLMLDKCACRAATCDGCDSCCDAGMLAPLPPTHHHAHPMHSHATPPVPQREVLLQPMGPSQWEGYPRVPMTDAPRNGGQHLGDDVLKKRSTQPAVPPPVRVPDPQPETRRPAKPTPEKESERGSLFDTLSDPFGDDEASVRRRYRPVRPTSYLENAPRPVKRRPLP